MKVLHVSTADSSGGAARAAYRLHRALLDIGMDSQMRVLSSGLDDATVKGGNPRSIARRGLEKLHKRHINRTQRNWYTDNPVPHTFGQIGAGLVNELNNSDVDILNLHWVTGMLSIPDIGRLQKPIVWTLHDMWAFCGAEHYASDEVQARFRSGYRVGNRPSGERGPDLNRKTWEAKRRAWAKQTFTLVSPSEWLADCARDSALLGHCPVEVVPNPLDTKYPWRPVPQPVARTALGLPSDAKLILMGADGGVRDPRKGGDLLRAAMTRVMEHTAKDDVRLLIFGQSATSASQDAWPCPVHWLGPVRDDRALALTYSAVDIMVVPSRQDNLPNTATEAQACGTPVVAFAIGGLPDIVEHQTTGWLAKPFDIEDLATGIRWMLWGEGRCPTVRGSARNLAVQRFAGPGVAERYKEIYLQAITRWTQLSQHGAIQQ